MEEERVIPFPEVASDFGFTNLDKSVSGKQKSSRTDYKFIGQSFGRTTSKNL
jgi:hypothetical protein